MSSSVIVYIDEKIEKPQIKSLIQYIRFYLSNVLLIFFNWTKVKRYDPIDSMERGYITAAKKFH